MSDITAERKLALIRSIREENDRNRMNIRSRQNLLYGNGYDGYAENSTSDMTDVSQRPASSFLLRLFTAIVLFSLYVVWDYTGVTCFSMNTETVSNLLQQNYEGNGIDFIEEITYTLKDV